MADFSFRLVQFQANTSVGNQTFTVTDQPTGKTAKIAFFAWGNATGIDTKTTNSSFSVGVTDGTTHRSCTFRAEDGATAVNADTAWGTDTATVMRQVNLSGVMVSEASWVSFGVDAVTVNWDTAPGTAQRGYVWLGFGADLQVFVTSAASAGSDGGTTNITPGFQTDGLIAVSVAQAFTADGGAGGDAVMSIGFAGRSTNTQSCAAIVGEDQLGGSTSAGCVTRNNRVMQQLLSASGAVTEGIGLEITNVTSTQVEITQRGVGAAIEAFYLCFRIAGGRVWGAAEAVASDNASPVSITSPGFHPITVLAAQVRNPTVNTVNSNAGAAAPISLGAAAAATQATVGTYYRDGIATSEADTVFHDSDTIAVLAGTTTWDWIAALSTFDLLGFTLSIGQAAADTPRYISFLAIEGTLPLVSTETEEISDGFVAKAVLGPSTETEELSDGHVAIAVLGPQTETEQISDDFVIVQAAPTSQILVIDETEEISESIAIAVKLVIDETIEIHEQTIFDGSALLVVNETEQISDDFVLYQGRILVVGETVEITDGTPVTVSTRTRRASARGGVFG